MAVSADAFFSSSDGAGNYKSEIAWINFEGLSPTTTTERITNRLPDQYKGYTISFEVTKESYVKVIKGPYNATVAFGVMAYEPPSDKDYNYLLKYDSASSPSTPTSTTNIIFDKIKVTDPAGNEITNYKIIVADAQYNITNGKSKENGENIILQTNGDEWQLIEMIPGYSDPSYPPIIEDNCTKTLKEYGYDTNSQTSTKSPLVCTNSASLISVSLQTITDGATFGSQAIAIGIIIYTEAEVVDLDQRDFHLYICPGINKYYFDLPYSSPCSNNIVQLKGLSSLPIIGSLGTYTGVYSYLDEYTDLLTGIMLTTNNTLTDGDTDILEFDVNSGTSSTFQIAVTYTFSSEHCDISLKKDVVTRLIDSITKIPIIGDNEIFFYRIYFANKTNALLTGAEVRSGIYGIKISDTFPNGLLLASPFILDINNTSQSIVEFAAATEFTGNNYGYVITHASSTSIEIFLPPTPPNTRAVLSLPMYKDPTHKILSNPLFENYCTALYMPENTIISNTVQAEYAICDVSIEKSADFLSYPGKDYSYILTIKNNGTLPATGLCITDSLDPYFSINIRNNNYDISITDAHGTIITGFESTYNASHLLTITDSDPLNPYSLDQGESLIITIHGTFIS